MHLYTLGPFGTFSHEAATTIFPDQQITLAANFDELFDRLEKDKEGIAVVPIENSLHGSVDEVLDLLRETDIRIWKTFDVAIKHAFGALDAGKVVRVASHPQALRQCRIWLKERFPRAEHFPVSSTAYALQLARKEATIGAIASEKSIRESDLKLMASDIEGSGNTTRFGIIAKDDPYPDLKRTQMSIVLHPNSDHPGLLHQLLTPFKIYDVNLSRIESRPTGAKLGDYVFFVDFFGREEDARIQKLFSEIKPYAEIQILGKW